MTRSHTRHELANGLTVFLKEIHTAPIISTWVWYRVGSRDETAGQTGISHWTEHMQFKGTPQFPASMLDKAISRDGGTWNAFTFIDWTTYFETMPAEKIDLALRLEADRMVNCTYDPQEVESERTVIISEREGNENDPLFKLSEAVQGKAFRLHPYAHEVLGNLEDLHSIQRDDLYQHYRRYYIPNNAVLAAAGDFNSEAMLERIRTLFEAIPASSTPPRQQIVEPPAEMEQRVDVEGPGETTFVQVAYHAPSGRDADFMCLSVLDSLLAGPASLNMFGGGGISNKTSRLYRALVEKELAVGIHGGLTTSIDPHLYPLTITVHPERTPEQALAAFDQAVVRIQDEDPPPEEVARAIKQARANFAYGTESITNQAFWLGHAEMFADYTWFTEYLQRLAEVTPQMVRACAIRYLKPENRVVGIYRPSGRGGQR